MHCPICQSPKFQKKSGRENARCVSCKAMERTRLLYKVLSKYEILEPNIRILHIEPEPSLAKIFTQISPSGYFSFSLKSNNNSKMLKLESPCDIDKFPHQSFDLIIHNHFLEQIPLPVKYTLRVFSDLLKPGGYHIFTTALEKGLTEEGSKDLSENERLQRFGQSNRFKKLGKDDFIPLLQDIWGYDDVYIKNEETFSLQEYLDAALPEKLFTKISPSTIFFQHHSPVK